MLTPTGLLDTAGREREVTALLALLDELAASAPTAQQPELARLHRHITLAVPGLLAFAPPLDRVQHDAAVVLGTTGVALVAWAWQRRAILGPRRDDLVAQFPPAWQPAARLLINAWETAVRASSAVENWHSILRPHLAVHRVLSPGLLALLVVWHNHRAFARGPHAGVSPLHLSGMTDAPADWLVALGYPPLDARLCHHHPHHDRAAHGRLTSQLSSTFDWSEATMVPLEVMGQLRRPAHWLPGWRPGIRARLFVLALVTLSPLVGVLIFQDYYHLVAAR